MKRRGEEVQSDERGADADADADANANAAFHVQHSGTTRRKQASRQGKHGQHGEGKKREAKRLAGATV
jgi:hypothetical protein